MRLDHIYHNILICYAKSALAISWAKKMVVHIVKLAVGIEDIAHLVQKQKARMKRDNALVHTTRNTPVRSNEILDGGSIFWVIKKFVRVRQRIISIETGVDSESRRSCFFVLDTKLIKTEMKEFKAFQGWRYFRDEEIPPDLNEIRSSGMTDEELPLDMRLELKTLGLL
jgi:hypothetical protein